MSTPDKYREWDAAYVMGSLSPAERREFEQHLSLCPGCAAAVSALAGLSGPLAALSADQAYALLEPEPGTPDLMPELLQRAERARRRTRWRTAAVAVTAAAAAVVISLTVPWDDLTGGPAGPSGLVAMQQVEPGPITANAKFVSGPWGTRIEGVCKYADRPGGSGKPYDYYMYVTDTYGRSTQVGSWKAKAGSAYFFSETTNIPRDHIAKVDIRAVRDGKEVVLLYATP